MTYPNVELEKLRLEMCKKMIETAQALLEPLPAMPVHERIIPQPPRELVEPLGKEEKVEPVQVQEEISIKSQSKEKNTTPLSRALTDEHQHDNRRVENSTGESSHSGIQQVPEVNDKWPEELWELVREAKEEVEHLRKPQLRRLI